MTPSRKLIGNVYMVALFLDVPLQISSTGASERSTFTTFTRNTHDIRLLLWVLYPRVFKPHPLSSISLACRYDAAHQRMRSYILWRVVLPYSLRFSYNGSYAITPVSFSSEDSPESSSGVEYIFSGLITVLGVHSAPVLTSIILTSRILARRHLLGNHYFYVLGWIYRS